MAQDRESNPFSHRPLAGGPNVSYAALTQSGRSRLGGALPCVFGGLAAFVPDRIVPNQELEHLGCDSEWIIQRTGIRERRWASLQQSSSDLAYEASVRCLQNSGVEPRDVDLILVATITPDHSTPSTACLLQQRLGCIAPAMDLSAACSGFMYALITGAQFLQSRAYRNVLIVGAEVMSRTVDPTDVKTFPLFGDGAGAVLLQPALEPTSQPALNGTAGTDSTPGILAYTLGSEGSIDALCVRAGGSREPISIEAIQSGRQYMRMDGRSVFKWAVRCVVDSCRDILAETGYQAADIDRVILHQANTRIIDSAMADLGFGSDQVIVNLDRYGNTSAASIPIAMAEAQDNGKLKRGDLVLLCGFGAGLTWGTGLIRW
jgi:3-oxoacyl-[acyl-carrier-protein] synthase-3